MEVAATSGYVQAVAAATERAPAEMRKAEQRDASVEGTRVALSAREERQRASQSEAPAMLYQQIGRARASGSASLSDEAIDLFSAHTETNFDARNQLASGRVIDTSTVHDPPAGSSSKE